MENPIENKWVDFEIKFGHNEGHTVFAINKPQNKLLTGGSDGEVRGWSVERTDDDDPESYDVGSSVYSIATSVGAGLFTGDSNFCSLLTDLTNLLNLRRPLLGRLSTTTLHPTRSMSNTTIWTARTRAVW